MEPVPIIADTTEPMDIKEDIPDRETHNLHSAIEKFCCKNQVQFIPVQVGYGSTRYNINDYLACFGLKPAVYSRILSGLYAEKTENISECSSSEFYVMNNKHGVKTKTKTVYGGDIKALAAITKLLPYKHKLSVLQQLESGSVDKLTSFIAAIPAPDASSVDIIHASSLSENDVVTAIHKKTGGRREFTLVSGKVDIYAHPYVIEVKKANKWKHALGQVLAYVSELPGTIPVLWLFDDNTLDARCMSTMLSVCSKYEVRVCIYNPQCIEFPPPRTCGPADVGTTCDKDFPGVWIGRTMGPSERQRLLATVKSEY